MHSHILQVLSDPLQRLAYAQGADLGDHDSPPVSQGQAWDGTKSGQPGAQRFQGFSLKDEVFWWQLWMDIYDNAFCDLLFPIFPTPSLRLSIHKNRSRKCTAWLHFLLFLIVRSLLLAVFAHLLVGEYCSIALALIYTWYTSRSCGTTFQQLTAGARLAIRLSAGVKKRGDSSSSSSGGEV